MCFFLLFIQSTGLVIKLNPLIVAICALKLAGKQWFPSVLCAGALISNGCLDHCFIGSLLGLNTNLLFTHVFTAPGGLREVVDFDAYLLTKFGADFIGDNITANMPGVGACLQKGQDWASAGSAGSGGGGGSGGNSGSGASNSAELLSACMRELKLKNKWKKE